MTDRREFFIKDEPLRSEPFHYAMCGVPNVYLLNGVEVFEDDGYGPSFQIRDIDGLHNAIAAAIVECPRTVTGAEVRFLRKRMGLTQAELARRVRSSTQNVANYEKGATGIPGPFDLMLRTVYMLHILPPDAGKAMLDELYKRVTEEAGAREHVIPLGTAWNGVPVYQGEARAC